MAPMAVWCFLVSSRQKGGGSDGNAQGQGAPNSVGVKHVQSDLPVGVRISQRLGTL